MIEEWSSAQELIDLAEERKCRIGDLVIEEQSRQLQLEPRIIMGKMRDNLNVMRLSAENGMKDEKSVSGLSGGMAKCYNESRVAGKLLSGPARDAVAYALAISEHNACMGQVVASPTAGSCGILPAVLLSCGKHFGCSEEDLVRALFNSSGMGMVIARRSSISGAQGGCQAECGSASAIAASAAVELMGGTPSMCGHACALALKFSMGLTCDPVAGLVEVPCVKRNASGAVSALTAAELALSGIESAIPVDEVIDAMKNVGDLMSVSLKETSLAGLAATKTALAIKARMERM